MDPVQPQPAKPAPISPAAAAPVAAPAQPVMVSFAEFKKLDIRTARVASVENHPNADKLYVLKVDLGVEQRQIVAGMRPFYMPEQLLGRTVVIVVNIEPAMLRGVQSQGMMLAVTDSPRVLVLQPDGGQATPGAKVS